MLARAWRKGNPIALLVGLQTSAVIVENSVEYPQKIKNGTALWPSESTSGNLSKETVNTNLKEYVYPYVHCRVIYNHQDLKAAQLSISRWVDKKTVVHLHNRILLGQKKEGNFTRCDNMDGLGENYVKCNKPVRERQIPHDFTHMWNLINNVN